MKSYLIFTAGLLLSGSVVAQDLLFPELSAPAAEPVPVVTQPVVEPETIQPETGMVQSADKPLSLYVDDTIPAADNGMATGATESGIQSDSGRSGNIKIVVSDIQSSIALAYTYSYCFAKVTVNNETNNAIKSMKIKLDYGYNPVYLEFSGVAKKSQATQDMTMIGQDCETAHGTPQMEVVSCSMDKLSETECKKRAELIVDNDSGDSL